MTFNTKCLPEPDLEFGDGGRHVDPRQGLILHGPLQAKPGDLIRVGVVGTAETVEGMTSFMERAMTGIPSANERLGNLNPAFPGIGNMNPFRCRFEIEPGATRAILGKDVKRIIAIPKHADAVRAAVDMFIDQVRALLEGSARPEVVVLALPKLIIDKVVNASPFPEDEGEDEDAGPSDLNFRDLFKAKAIALRVPTQIVWPTLWDDAAKLSRKTKDTDRKVQAPATRAWNVLNALFYKAGRIPWRLPRPEGAFATSYLGIGFYKDLDGQRLWTSTAQMFDERGKGLILRGARARTDRPGKHPYLNREDAYALARESLKHYQLHHRHTPARIVLMKTSRFELGEVEGFTGAIEEMGVAMTDMLWISEGAHLMLMREGDYPSLRGSYVQVGGNGLLYTRGSVPYYGTYPGTRVPRPLQLRPHECETPLGDLAAEVLALTKMNWNTTQFDQASPIPIRAARQVGRVLKHISYGDREESDYTYYM